MLKVASWNVNSLKVRLEQVLAWIASSGVDILALQETKLTDESFPVDAFTANGLSVVFSGQKTYNGTAIISRLPIRDVMTDIPGFDDPQRRILAASLGDLRLINLYVPNGSEVGTDKYVYKLAWLKQVTEFIRQQLEIYPKLAVVGDFNIAPDDKDVHSSEIWKDCILVSAPERQAFFHLIELGLLDSFRVKYPDVTSFSWWDYRAAGFRRNLGLRIDHILLSKPLMESCGDAGIDIEPRRAERPSDHAPVWVQLT
jgi:exodeoxyribonuclease-3